jgi:hypothetical protein
MHESLRQITAYRGLVDPGSWELELNSPGVDRLEDEP